MPKYFPKLKDAAGQPKPKERKLDAGARASRRLKRRRKTASEAARTQNESISTREKRRSGLKLTTKYLAFFKPTRPYSRYVLKLLGLGAGAGAIALGAGWLALENSLPKSAQEVLNYTRPQTLTIKADNGTILKQVGDATREEVKIDKVPKPLLQAFVATEDRRFYQHQGVDYQGILRAVVSNFQAQDVVEGGSTVTQQVARMVFFDQERNIWRKLREFRMAQKIEGELTKEQILERYLNLIYLGKGAYGIADAAWVYFSKPIDRLTLSEMAMLAGLPASPSQFSPIDNPQAAKQRRDLVLGLMQESGYITASEAENAKQEPLTVNQSRPKRLEQQAPYFSQYIQQELPKYVSAQILKTGGLTVETTLNPKWQAEAETAIANIIKERGVEDNFSQAALVAINPRNGQIEAMVGGKSFEDNQFNRATQAQRQPGSTFKTFVYTTAIAAGYTPYRSYLDEPVKFDKYQPKNFSESYSGWMSMRDALVDSVNVVALKVMLDVGWNPTIQMAKKMGIESELKPTYALALGGSEVNLLELTGAYGTLANKGTHVKPHAIRRIIDQKGQVIYEEKISSQRVVDEETSSIVTWMLKGVVDEGTGQKARLSDRPVAGKTGTSDKARDLLFVGYIPQLVTGVWLGNDDNKPTWGASSAAAQTWHNFMEPVVKEMPPEEFPKRPEKLEGRTALVKVEPIKPKVVEVGKITPEPDPDDNEEDTPKLAAASAPASAPARPIRRRVARATEDTERSETRRTRRRRARVQEDNQDNSEERTSTRRTRRRARVQEDNQDNSEERTSTRRSRRRARVQENNQDNSEERTSTRRSRRRARVQEDNKGNSEERTSTRRSRRRAASEPEPKRQSEKRSSRRQARVKPAESNATEKPATKRRVRSSRKSTTTSPASEPKRTTSKRAERSPASETRRSTRTRTYHESRGSGSNSRSDKE